MLHARRTNQSTLKEINPECSLEGLMLKLKLQYFCHLIWTADSRDDANEDPDAGEDWRQKEKGTAEEKMVSITDSMDMNLSKLQEIMEDRGAWCARVHGVTKSWMWLSDWTTTMLVRWLTGKCYLLNWKWKSLSCVQLFVTPWTIQSMEFSRPEYCSG